MKIPPGINVYSYFTDKLQSQKAPSHSVRANPTLPLQFRPVADTLAPSLHFYSSIFLKICIHRTNDLEIEFLFQKHFSVSQIGSILV